MTQPSNLIPAKQGDPEAIAALMNATLQPRGITATTEVRQGDLHIFFTSDRALPQPALVDFTKKGLVKLGVVSFPVVWIYAYPSGEDLPLWIESIPNRGRSGALSGHHRRDGAPPFRAIAPPTLRQSINIPPLAMGECFGLWQLCCWWAGRMVRSFCLGASSPR